MTSISPSTTTTFTPLSVSPLKRTSFIPKPSQLSGFRHPTRRCFARKPVSCKAAAENNQQPSNPNLEGLFNNKLDRRNILLGLGGGLATTLGGASQSSAAPAIVDWASCSPTDGSGGGPEGLQCCPPDLVGAPIIDFDIKNYPTSQTRVRPPAHKVLANSDYLRDFQNAISEMKKLDPKDPLNFYNQANVHCAYCEGSYSQLGHPTVKLQIHSNWFFFPWHRCYLFFYERIIGKMLGNLDFAMPYWNWDNRDGMTMPAIYDDCKSPLYNPKRNFDHRPPTVMDLAYNSEQIEPPGDLKCYNLQHMHRQMMDYTKPELFMGLPYRAGDIKSAAGSIERLPHNTVHNWTAGPCGDMGAFFSAAKDPIFFAHHANIDRMWSIWKTLGEDRKDFADPDWLNAYFIFYDEERRPVRIYIRDVLDDERQLGYKYEDSEIRWREPVVCTFSPSSRGRISPMSLLPVNFPKSLENVVRTGVKRPRKGRSKKEKMEEEEVLVIDLQLVKDDEYVKFDVYINDTSDHQDLDKEITEPVDEYAGSYVNLPHNPKKAHDKTHVMNTSLMLPLNKLLDRLKIDNNEDIEVTLVPRAGKDAVIVTSVKIDFI